MTEYQLALQEVEAIKVSLVVCVNFFLFTRVLSKLYEGVKSGFSASFVGVLIILTEIITSFILISPLIILYVMCGISVCGFATNIIYLGILWFFRHRIVKLMNKFFDEQEGK